MMRLEVRMLAKSGSVPDRMRGIRNWRITNKLKSKPSSDPTPRKPVITNTKQINTQKKTTSKSSL
jgi:hypothetical protein